MSTLRVDNVTDLDDDPVVTAGVVAGGALPAGSILQVVSTTKTDTFSTTSSSFTAITGLSATITPSSASNKILVLVDLFTSNSTNTAQDMVRLMRDATAISVGAASGSRAPTSVYSFVTPNNSSGNQSGINFLDSPATTSAITYSLQSKTSGGTHYVNRTGADSDNGNFPRTASGITLMEVAG